MNIWVRPIANDGITMDPPRFTTRFTICASNSAGLPSGCSREHPDGNPAELLAQIVNRVVKRGGSIVIPSFAIGRTQMFMYYLRQLEDQQRIPRVRSTWT